MISLLKAGGIIGIFFFGGLTQAETSLDYQRRRDAVLQEYQQVHSEKTQLEGRYQVKVEEKNQVLQKAHDQIQTLGMKQQKGLQLELSSIRERGRRVYLTSKIYLDAQTQFAKDFKEINAKFKEYQRLHSAHQTKIKSFSRAVNEAKIAKDLLPAKKVFEDIQASEISWASHLKTRIVSALSRFKERARVYQEEISKDLDFMVQYQFKKIEPPHVLLDSLEKKLTYIDERSLTYQADLKQKLNKVLQLGDLFLRESLEKAKNQHESVLRFYQESEEWISHIHQLIQKLNAASERTGTFKKAVGQLLEAQYEVYQEILSYQKMCEVLEKNEESALYHGCLLILELVEEAESFMNRIAWSKIGFTLFNLGAAPPPFSERLSQLKQRRARSGEADLLEAIRLHDALLQDWDAFLVNDSSSQKGGKKE